MIVQILGTNEMVEVPDEPHPVEFELEAFEILVRARALRAGPERLVPAKGAPIQ